MKSIAQIALRWLMDPLLGIRVPFTTFFIAIVFAVLCLAVLATRGKAVDLSAFQALETELQQIKAQSVAATVAPAAATSAEAEGDALAAHGYGVLGFVAVFWSGALWAVPAGLIGARAYHVATDHDLYFGKGGNPVGALEIWHGGLGIWGAIAGGLFGAWLYCRRHGILLRPIADALAPTLLLAQAMGRFGNVMLINGETTFSTESGRTLMFTYASEFRDLKNGYYVQVGADTFNATTL